MSNLHYKYVLVGGGLASSSAALAIRQADSEGSMLLIGQEINRPYYRTLLAKDFLNRRKTHSDLFTMPAEWFARHNVDLRTGRRASRLDTPRRSIMLDSGEEISFDKLLIATGGAPKRLTVPGATMANVHYLRTLEDADQLLLAIDKSRREGRPHPQGRGRVTLIGGGLGAIELAATLRDLRLHVDLLLSQSYPMHHELGEDAGKAIQRVLEGRGIVVHAGQHPLRFIGDGRVQRVLASNEQNIDCDFVLAAVGLQPSKDLLRATPIAAETAILVDDHCRTTVPDIYAAGDCAAIFDPIFGKHRLLDHWDSAALTGQIAGVNMAGGNLHFDALSHAAGLIFDVPISLWGEPRLVERRLIRGSPWGTPPDFLEIGIAADGRLATIAAIGHRQEPKVLAELVRRRLSIQGNEERLKDPHRPLEELLQQEAAKHPL